MNKVLVTGGTGYIGSHTVIELLNDNQDVVIVDNLSNSKIGVVDRIEQITGKRPAFYNVDVRDKAKLLKIFKDEKPTDVIHFAGLKAVGESVKIPLAYYDNNLNSTLVLIDCMRECGVKNLVFSSSATVYGCPKSVPIFEDFPLSATNPYGQTKLMIEQIMKKYKKGCSVAETADMLEENPSVIEQIYDILRQNAPDYDVQKIYQSLLKKNTQDSLT